jgi:hypothetical protein
MSWWSAEPAQPGVHRRRGLPAGCGQQMQANSLVARAGATPAPDFQREDLAAQQPGDGAKRHLGGWGGAASRPVERRQTECGVWHCGWQAAARLSGPSPSTQYGRAGGWAAAVAEGATGSVFRAHPTSGLMMRRRTMAPPVPPHQRYRISGTAVPHLVRAHIDQQRPQVGPGHQVVRYRQAAQLQGRFGGRGCGG